MYIDMYIEVQIFIKYILHLVDFGKILSLILMVCTPKSEHCKRKLIAPNTKYYSWWKLWFVFLSSTLCALKIRYGCVNIWRMKITKHNDDNK